MDSLTDDLWAIILVRLPLKTITASKLGCKQWKSFMESSFLRDLFLSHHQNSHPSSWSLLLMRKNYPNDPIEVLAHYGCDILGLPRSLNSYTNSFIINKFLNHREIYKHAIAVGYTDVGLVLIRVVSGFENVSYYVANPVLQECVETDPPWFEPKQDCPFPLGIATRTEKNGVLLGFKVVLLVDARSWNVSCLSLLIYSSETGLWRPETVHFPLPLLRQDYHNSISSNGNLHLLALNDNNDEVVVSIDFYSTGTGSVRCLVTPFPDLDMSPKFNRVCTTCQGFLMYMNVVSSSKDDKLCVWRLKSGIWQLVSEIAFKNGFNGIPLAINPFDAKSIYFWSKFCECLLSINLRNGKFVCHNSVECSSSGRILSSVECAQVMENIRDPTFSSFVLPQWLHRIPNIVRKV